LTATSSILRAQYNRGKYSLSLHMFFLDPSQLILAPAVVKLIGLPNGSLHKKPQILGLNIPAELCVLQHGRYDQTWLILLMYIQEPTRNGKASKCWAINDGGTCGVVQFDGTSAGHSLFVEWQVCGYTKYQRTAPNSFYSDNAHARVGACLGVINTLA